MKCKVCKTCERMSVQMEDFTVYHQCVKGSPLYSGSLIRSQLRQAAGGLVCNCDLKHAICTVDGRLAC